jgi:hypothetical protein
VQPIAKFLMAPPNPLNSWPLQWETTIMASVSAMTPETSILSKYPLV